MSFERLNGTLRRLFGRLRVDAGNVGGASSDNGLEINQTWNTTGNPTALKVNVTNTASGSSANLLDLMVGGSTKCSINKEGKIVLSESGLDLYGSIYFTYLNGITDSGKKIFLNRNNGIKLASDMKIAFGYDATALETASISSEIRYDGTTGALGQRYSTTAQESRLYGTYTTATS